MFGSGAGSDSEYGKTHETRAVTQLHGSKGYRTPLHFWETSPVWSVFPTSTNYFDPSHAPFMVNYIVDDLDVLLDRLKQEGVKIDDKRMNESYGRFAWIYDLDGNKIELWQPLSAKP